MNICLISNEYPPETGFGGIGTYTHSLAHGLAKRGNKVDVISKAVGKPETYPDGLVTVHRIKDDRVPLKGISKIANLVSDSGFGHYWHSRSVFKYIDRLIKNGATFDIIEGPLWDGECVAYSQKLEIPLVVRLQTPIFVVREILNLGPRKILEYIEKRSLQKATIIAAISQDIGHKIAKFYDIDKNKIVYSPLGVELKVNEPSFKKNSFKLLYVGRLEQRKGTLEFLNALPTILTQNPKISVDIVGKDCYQAPGGISYITYFNNLVPANLKSRVTFHGFVDTQQLAIFYKNCDVFIAPSRYESFGLVFLEAMSYGKPVIATKIGGIPEIVKDGQVGLLADINNSAQIAKLVTKIFQNENYRKMLSEQAFKLIKSNYSIEKTVDTTLKVYQRAIADYKVGLNE